MTGSSSASLPTADFGTRFSAFMVDAAVLFAAQWLIFMVLSRQLQAVGMTTTEPCDAASTALCEGPSTLLWVLLTLFLLASTVAYHAVFEGLYGATPGKRWLGLAVVTPDGRSPVGLAAGTLRSVIRQSFWLALFFVLEPSPLSLGLPSILFIALPILTLGVFVLGAFSPNGRAGHDLVARTLVVRTDQVEVARSTTTPQPKPTRRPIAPSTEENAENSA